MEEDIKLTKLASCGGCGAKVGDGVLAQLLEGLQVHSDPKLIVGFDKSDDASVYKVSDELALVQTVDFFRPWWMIRIFLAKLRQPMPCRMCMPWAANRNWR